MNRLDSVANFTEFVKAFSVFGTEMVELAYLTSMCALPQGDPLNERRRAQMSAARNVLERSTIMLLTSTKLCLRQPDSVHFKENRDTVFCQMRRAMDLIHHVVKDGMVTSSAGRRSGRTSTINSTTDQSTVEWDTHRGTASSCLRYFARLMESSRPQFNTVNNAMPKSSLKDVSKTRSESLHSSEHDVIINERRELMRSNSERDRQGNNNHNHHQHHHSSTATESLSSSISSTTATAGSATTVSGYGKSRSYLKRSDAGYMSRNEALNIGVSILSPQTREELMHALDKCVEKTQDFTDSAYTTHEHRENILLLNDRIRLELNQCLRIAVNMEQFPNSHFDIDSAVDSVLSAAQDLTHQLSLAVADQIAELNHVIKTGMDLVNSLRNIALNQELDRLQECADQFHDYIDHILEVSTRIHSVGLSCFIFV